MSHLDINFMMVNEFSIHDKNLKTYQNQSISMNKNKIGMISKEGLTIRDKKTGRILFQDRTVEDYEKIEMNDRFLVYTRNDNIISIHSLNKVKEIYELKCSFDKIFSIYENRIGFIKENNVYDYIVSVFNIETCETEFEMSIKKTNNRNEAEDWYFRYKESRVKVWEDYISISIGTNQCYLYHIPSKKLIQEFEMDENIIGLGMNSNYIILIGEWQDPTRIHIFNYKTKETFKFWSYLDHTQLNTKFDISEDYLFLTCYRGVSYETEWMEIYDLHTKGIYKQKLGNGHTTGLDISVYKNEILVSTSENRLKLFEINKIPKKEILLAMYQKQFGKIGENSDIRRYILEYLFQPIIEKEGKTVRKENNFILHTEKHEIPRIEIFYK